MVHYIQHQDKNAGPADYEGLSPLLRVTKIFYTIQGEGPYAGHPAVFVRLAGCNRGQKEGMGCEFCDTSFELENSMSMTVEQVVKAVRECAPEKTIEDDRFSSVKVLAYPYSLVVITGGEPMLQPMLPHLCRALQEAGGGLTVQIESNGDNIQRPFIDGPYPLRSTVKLVVSPKVTKGVYREPRVGYINRVDAFKFVVSADTDSPYFSVPAWATQEEVRGKVYISPLTVYKRAVRFGEVPNMWDSGLIDREATMRNYKHASDICMECGFRFSCQTHLFMGQE